MPDLQHSKDSAVFAPAACRKALNLIGGLTAMGLATCAQAAAAFDSESPWMLGDWNGTRSELAEKGYDFKLDYTGEMGSNLHGGYDHDRTARYSDQFGLGTHLDLQKILGWDDAELQLTITERNGNNISNDRINDPRVGGFTSAQEVWGRGQTWRLTQMWYQQKFLDQALDIKVGRFGEGEDFNSFPCDFQNLAFCGSQVGNWAGGIWYNWPVSQWAMRVKYHLTPELYAQVGAYEQNPSNLDRDNGFSLMESGAILLYLAEKAGKLLPTDHLKRYRVIEWLMWQMGGPGPMLGQVHHFVKYNKGKAPYAEERYRKEAQRLYSVLDRQLEGRAFVCDAYSIADIAIWPWISRFEWQEIDMNTYPNVKRWYVALANRPAVIKGYAVPKDTGPIPLP